MSFGAIVTLGFSPSGSIGLIPTLGYVPGSAPTPPPPPVVTAFQSPYGISFDVGNSAAFKSSDGPDEPFFDRKKERRKKEEMIVLDVIKQFMGDR